LIRASAHPSYPHLVVRVSQPPFNARTHYVCISPLTPGLRMHIPSMCGVIATPEWLSQASMCVHPQYPNCARVSMSPPPPPTCMCLSIACLHLPSDTMVTHVHPKHVWCHGDLSVYGCAPVFGCGCGSSLVKPLVVRPYGTRMTRRDPHSLEHTPSLLLGVTRHNHA
jgi:hypothetical protein